MNRWHVSILVERSLTGRSACGVYLLRQCGAGRPAGESEANDKRHENDGADRHARLLVISRHDHGPWKHVSLTHCRERIKRRFRWFLLPSRRDAASLPGGARACYRQRMPRKPRLGPERRSALGILADAPRGL